MTRLRYQDQLQELRDAVCGEIAAVERQLERVLDAVKTGDETIAAEVVRGDEEIDRRYAQLQNDLVAVIARQAPVASDLRQITALLHISRMVERMGDQCVNVAKLVPVGGVTPAGGETLRVCLADMGGHALVAVQTVARALGDWDAVAADGLADSDQDVNELNRTCFTRAVELGGSESARTWATAMILVARAFERIGDNAVDVGAHLRFAVDGNHGARPATSAEG